MSKFVILPKDSLVKKCTKEDYKKTCIIFHLYYLDEIDLSYDIIKNIPKDIDVYIITANIELKDYLNKRLKKANIKIILKENRGRDFAALFVVGNDFIWKYEYVCFVHDKKSHKGDDKERGVIWYKAFLENLVGSNTFIYNVINYFNENKKVGLLSAPFPTKLFFERYGCFYDCNLKLTKKILKELGISTKIDISYKPIGLGVGLWFRTDALKKIKKLKLSYTDFEEEPMPYDGGFAHAIERIIEPITISSGYEAANLLNDKYACKYCEENDDLFFDTAMVLRNNNLLKCRYGKIDLSKSNLTDSKNRMIEFGKNYRKVFVVLDKDNVKANTKIKQLKKYGINIFYEYNIDEIDFNTIKHQNYFGCIILTNKKLNEIVKKIEKTKIDYFIEKV